MHLATFLGDFETHPVTLIPAKLSTRHKRNLFGRKSVRK
jgi:hypothetical protein